MFRMSKNRAENYNESNDNETPFLKTKLFIYIANMIHFGVSILMFVIGIVYLTAFRYDFSFTAFSTTLVAGLFVAFSVIVLAASVIVVVALQFNRKPVIVVASFVILILFVVLFAVGIWGLSASTSDTLEDDIKNSMIIAMSSYDPNNPTKYETAEIDWLQGRFNCCGLYAYTDWRSNFYQSYSNMQNQQVYFANTWSANLNYPYLDTVPDSCCKRKSYNCGKTYTNHNSHREMIIHTNGCLKLYANTYYKDLILVAALCVAIASFSIVVWAALLVTYLLIKMKQ